MNLPALAAPVEFHWHLATFQQCTQIHAIHVAARQDSAAGVVRPDELGHFERHTGQDGLIVACKNANDTLVAYGILGVNSETTTHIGQLLNLDDADQQRFAVLDGSAALPDWRGYTLHQASIEQRLLCARQIGRSLLGATVSPHNHYSMFGLLKAGFVVAGFALVYQGLERLLLKKDLLARRASWIGELTVPVLDQQAHRAALARGLSGYACSQDARGAWQVHYGYQDRRDRLSDDHFVCAAARGHAGAEHRSSH